MGYGIGEAFVSLAMSVLKRTAPAFSAKHVSPAPCARGAMESSKAVSSMAAYEDDYNVTSVLGPVISGGQTFTPRARVFPSPFRDNSGLAEKASE